MTVGSLEKLAGEQTRRLIRMQVFLASANQEIVAARANERYLAYVIREMQQTLRQELLPLLTHCSETANAAAEWSREKKYGYPKNDRRAYEPRRIGD